MPTCHKADCSTSGLENRPRSTVCTSRGKLKFRVFGGKVGSLVPYRMQLSSVNILACVFGQYLEVHSVGMIWSSPLAIKGKPVSY